jgi:hypothetical protein
MTDRPELERQIANGAETVVVTQADLNAAADLIEQYWSGADESMMRLAKDTRNGHRQGAFPRAFARHRLATQADALAVMREAEGALAELAAEKPGARPRALRTLANLRAAIARREGE